MMRGLLGSLPETTPVPKECNWYFECSRGGLKAEALSRGHIALAAIESSAVTARQGPKPRPCLFWMKSVVEGHASSWPHSANGPDGARPSKQQLRTPLGYLPYFQP